MVCRLIYLKRNLRFIFLTIVLVFEARVGCSSDCTSAPLLVKNAIRQKRRTSRTLLVRLVEVVIRIDNKLIGRSVIV